jgi:hypothetical protein
MTILSVISPATPWLSTHQRGRLLPTLGLALFLVLLLASLPAMAADAVRCHQSLVGTGATLVEVLERCGEPEHEYARVDYRYPGYAVHVDEWTYANGRNRFRRVLHFENGRLRDIELRSKPRHSRVSARY